MQNTQLPNLNVQWLIDPAVTAIRTAEVFPATTGLQREDIPIPADVGQGWIERLPLADGLSLMYGVHQFKSGHCGSMLQLGEFDVDFPELSLSVQSIQGGNAHHREFHPRVQLLFKPGFDLFRHANRFHTIPSIDSSSNSEMTCLVVADRVLVSLLGADVTKQLLEGLTLAAPPAVKVLPMPLYISDPLRSAVSPKLQGQLKILWAQSKVLEYLCGLAGFVGAQESVLSVPNSKIETLRELRAYLMGLEGKLPTLEELSSKFGMSPRWLTKAFAKEYGQTIYSFIMDHRLNEAHIALVKSSVPIKTISEALNYSHVNNFIGAFKKKFGYPPGHLRKKGNAKESL